jgi:hypothetical protein
MAATYNKYYGWVNSIHNAGINIGSDTLKLALLLDDAGTTVPVATNTVWANISSKETAGAGHGYVAGGASLSVGGGQITTNTQSSGTYTLAGSQVQWTASGGTIGPFRYVVLYDSSPNGSIVAPLICWWDYGSDITLNVGDSFTVQFNSANPGTIYTAS